MVQKLIASVPGRDVTPEEVFFNRRAFLKQSLAIGTLTSTAAFCDTGSAEEEEVLRLPIERPDVFPAQRNPGYALPNEVDKELTPRLVAGMHNNYYEFLPNRGGPVYKYVDDFKVDPWTIKVRGECRNPMTLSLDDLFKFNHEERIYHFRCVERWAMNIPWSGFPLSKLIEKADPTAKATHVRFLSANRPKQMPGLAKTGSSYSWPYHEGLRLDEAMNELAMVVTGVYGKPLPVQHGAPVRIIVPWKYGYKNPKSIVRIEFVRKEPKTFWQIYPHEYGFLSNVNPNIPHPRWSQERSYWLGKQDQWFPTPVFNGYDRFVAKLYPDEPRTPQTALRRGQVAR